MPIQPINYAGMPLLDSPWDKDFGEILKRGMQLGQEPGRLNRLRQSEELANKLSGEQYEQLRALTPYAAQNAQNNAAILQNTANYAPRMSEAEIRKAEALAAMGGMQFPGGMGLVQGEEAARRMWGANDPRTLRVLEGNDTLFNQRRSGISKIHNEIDNISQQLQSPSLSEGKREELKSRRNQLENDAFNKQSDLDVREKALGAELMEQTWDTFIQGPSMEALKKYTGPKGSFKFYKDAIQYGVTGVAPDEDFNNYLAARNQLYTLADQYMKAFPGSQNYGRVESVHRHVNPESPFMAPGALEASIKSTWKTIEPELQTYKDVLYGENPLRGPKKSKQENIDVVKKQAEEYRKNNPKNEDNKSPMQSSASNVNWVRENGKWVKK